MRHTSDDFLLAAHGIAPLPVTSGRLRRWIGRTIERQMAAEARNSASRDRGEAERLAAIPDYLLYDMGLTRDNVPSLARQLRPERER